MPDLREQKSSTTAKKLLRPPTSGNREARGAHLRATMAVLLTLLSSLVYKSKFEQRFCSSAALEDVAEALRQANDKTSFLIVTARGQRHNPLTTNVTRLTHTHVTQRSS